MEQDDDDDAARGLHAACQRGARETAEALLNRGAEIDRRDLEGWTPLMYACGEGRLETAKLLLIRGAEVGLQNADGWTALMVACWNDRMKVGKLLLNYGAKVDEQKRDGRTALMLASEFNCVKTAKLLLNRGAKVDLQDTKGRTALLMACLEGHTTIARLLIYRGAHVDLQLADGRTPLMLACQKNYTTTARLLLDRGAEVDLQGADGRTSLMVACHEGHTEVAKLLLDRGAEVDLPVTDGRTPLMMACQEGHAETAKVLLDGGAEIDLQDPDGWTPLAYACVEGHLEAAKLLLDRGAEIDLQDPDGWTTLMIACRAGLAKAVKLLLDRGADVDVQMPDGRTALMLACEFDRTDAARLLLDRGANPYLHDTDGWTAFMLACRNGCTETATLLLNRGAEVDPHDEDGQTALMSMIEGGHTEAVRLLLDRGAEVDAQRADCRTALMLACEFDRSDVAQLLLDHGAMIDHRDTNGRTALVWASQKGRSEIIKLLIDRGAAVDLHDENGWSALMVACQGGHTDAAKVLLDRGARARLQMSDGWTALMLACQEGHSEVVKLLLDRGAEVDLQKADGWTALMSACHHGHPEAAKLILDRGAKVDLQDMDGETALMAACWQGHVDIVKVLLDRGAKVGPEVTEGWTALMLACQEGHSEAAKLLLDRGARVDLQKADGWTALMSACHHGHPEAVRVLLDRGAKVDLQDADAETALMAACLKGHTEPAKMLLDRGAKVDLRETEGCTALKMACEGGHTETVNLLLDRAAEGNLQDRNGRTALMSACQNGHAEAARLLLEHGAEIDLKDANGWTGLMLASEKGHMDAAKLLLDRGAEVDLQETNGWTALMLACEKGLTKAVKLLLDHGAKVDLQKTDGRTALIPACEQGHTEIAELLLNYGAKVDLQDTEGWTALMSACLNGHTKAAEMLLDRGAKVDLQDAGGWTALLSACKEGQTEAAKLLLDRGAEVNLQSPHGWTALIFASQEGCTEAAKLLLDCGAEVNMQDTDGWTALMSACCYLHTDVAALLLDRGAKVDTQDAEGKTALHRATQGDLSIFGRDEMVRRALSTTKKLCMRSDRLSFADLGGPGALSQARENRLYATAELLDFLSESSPLASYELPLKTLACFYARNVRTPQAAADLSSPELYFAGLKDSKQRHKAMKRFLADSQAEEPGGDSLDALALMVERARDAHKRGQDALECNLLADLRSLLSLQQPYRLAASSDFDVAMNTLREARQRLEGLQARVADDVGLVVERDEACDKLACLMTATISGAFRYSMQRLEKNYDSAAEENMCSRVWARLSDEPFAGHDGPSFSDQDTERACQVPEAAIATWKQREKVSLARRKTDAAVDTFDPAAQAQGPGLTAILRLVPGLASTELEGLENALKQELRALREDDPMDETPLAEIRCALGRIARRHAEARQIELANCRATAHAMEAEVDELVSSCSKPSTAALEGLIDRIYEVQNQREELKMSLRHARGGRPRVRAGVDVEKLARLEGELESLPCVYKLDCELREERARVIRNAERYFPRILQNPTWRKQIELSSEALVGVGKLELWLAHVTRADFAQIEALATRPGKEVHKVTDPDGRVMVLKSFHLADNAWHDRFCRQIQVLAELESAHLVRIEALFMDASFACILMPYYESGDLASWIRGNPHESDETRKRIAVGVLTGVHDLHKHNLVHCDIKPENIFLTQALTPVLGDSDGIQMSDVTMAPPLRPIGRYIAPELRADGISKVAPAVDLFSVGVVLGELFPAPSAALRDLISELQAGDPTQRPSALEALGHEAFQTVPMRPFACLICLKRYSETDGVRCSSGHFACKTCLGGAVRAASQPGAHAQLKRDCSMPCLASECTCALSGSDLAMAAPTEFETLLKVVRKHHRLKAAAGAGKENQHGLNRALRGRNVDSELLPYIKSIRDKILTLSCPRCETAFVDFDGCCAMQCSNPSCACYFCAWCLESPGGWDVCRAHVALCPGQPPRESNGLFSEREVVESAWCQLRATRLRAYIRSTVEGRILKKRLCKAVKPLLTADIMGPGFKF